MDPPLLVVSEIAVRQPSTNSKVYPNGMWVLNICYYYYVQTPACKVEKSHLSATQ